MKHKFYSLAKQGSTAVIDIFGDISSWGWGDSKSASGFKQELEELGDVDSISVNINSYGGEVADGLAIYNTLRNHKATVTTHVNGFACSIASVIFMAGDVRIMDESSLLMIHNAWTWAEGNAEELRKQADDLETITEASVKAYMSRVSIEEDELREMMDNETWISPETAKEKGFATSIEKHESENPSQNARKKVQQMILHNPYQLEDEELPEDEETNEEEPEEEPAPEDPEEPEKEPEEPEEAENEEPEEDPEQLEDEEPEEPEDAAKQCAFFRAIAKL